MTTEEKISYIRRTMSNARGDDLERCRQAFNRFSPEEMQNQWGHSGETCAAILADYEERRKRHTEASEFLETLLKGVSI